ncbi:hypothetical protein EVA_13769 [gut metagenome]|uniref:Uncharacterized protein n=1 Tax=gut metagenome TaxID=749906 RepID=J9GFL3_9ZZZZ
MSFLIPAPYVPSTLPGSLYLCNERLVGWLQFVFSERNYSLADGALCFLYRSS